MAARGEVVIGKGRSDECAGARRSGKGASESKWEGSGGWTLRNIIATRASSHVHWPIFFN